MAQLIVSGIIILAHAIMAVGCLAVLVAGPMVGSETLEQANNGRLDVYG